MELTRHHTPPVDTHHTDCRGKNESHNHTVKRNGVDTPPHTTSRHTTTPSTMQNELESEGCSMHRGWPTPNSVSCSPWTAHSQFCNSLSSTVRSLFLAILTECVSFALASHHRSTNHRLPKVIYLDFATNSQTWSSTMNRPPWRRC
jgi:hypothetical protein